MAGPRIYWVKASLPGGLAVVSRPRSVGDFGSMKAAGIDVLVSLMEPDEAREMGLADEAGECARAGIVFVSLPVADHGIPDSFEVVEAAVAQLAQHIDAGRGVGAHCFAGLGRSPLLVAAVLLQHGYSYEEAIQLVSAARGHDVPEMDDQHAWLAEFAERN